MIASGRARARAWWRTARAVPDIDSGTLPTMRSHLKRAVKERLGIATTGTSQWIRTAMTTDTEDAFNALEPATLRVAEISGKNWTHLPWASHTVLEFPEFDLCSPP